MELYTSKGHRSEFSPYAVVAEKEGLKLAISIGKEMGIYLSVRFLLLGSVKSYTGSFTPRVPDAFTELKTGESCLGARAAKMRLQVTNRTSEDFQFFKLCQEVNVFTELAAFVYGLAEKEGFNPIPGLPEVFSSLLEGSFLNEKVKSVFDPQNMKFESTCTTSYKSAKISEEF